MGICRLIILAALLPLTGCATVAEDFLPPASAPPPRSPLRSDVVLAMSTDAPPHTLRVLRARTLKPVGSGVDLQDAYSVSAVSPDGRRLALGSNRRGRIDIVDLARMRHLRTIHLGGQGAVLDLAWPARHRMLALVDGPLRAGVVNPTTGGHGAFRRFAGTPLGYEAGPAGVAVLLAPAEGIGTVEVAVFDGHGLRSVALPGFIGGSDMSGGVEEAVEIAMPAFVVEPGGRRALVISQDNRMAEVDLRSLAVSRHEPDSSGSLFGRVRNWLEPTAEAKLMEGWDRYAVWLPGGLVVVSGTNYSVDGVELEQEPAGATLIDTRDWSVDELDPDTTSVEQVENGFALLEWKGRGNRRVATVYDGAAHRRFRLERATYDLLWIGRYLYVGSRGSSRYEVVDSRTRATVARRALGGASWLFRPD